MMKTIRIILAEDQIMVRESFRIALEKSPHLKIVGEVEDGKDLIKLWKKLKPDLLVVDNQLIQMDGIEAIKTIRKTDGAVKIIMITAFSSADLIREALSLHVNGFLLKLTNYAAFLGALEAVMKGVTVFSPELVFMLTNGDAVPYPDHATKEILSIREISILRAYAHGKTSKDIAEELKLSLNTIYNHKKKIFRKLGLTKATELHQAAVNLGIIP